LDKYLREAVEKMERDGIRLALFGDLAPLGDSIRSLIRQTEEINERIEGFQVNLCLNYGGRDEIRRAAAAFARDCVDGVRRPEELTEEMFSGYLYSKGIPEPELVIRPSGEQRISNFLLWQSAYSEFYYTDLLWPDFTPSEIDRAIEAFRKRERRFGAV
jgi:undecaprenyl diphosphate synthase